MPIVWSGQLEAPRSCCESDSGEMGEEGDEAQLVLQTPIARSYLGDCNGSGTQSWGARMLCICVGSMFSRKPFMLRECRAFESVRGWQRRKDGLQFLSWELPGISLKNNVEFICFTRL